MSLHLQLSLGAARLSPLCASYSVLLHMLIINIGAIGRRHQLCGRSFLCNVTFSAVIGQRREKKRPQRR